MKLGKEHTRVLAAMGFDVLDSIHLQTCDNALCRCQKQDWLGFIQTLKPLSDLDLPVGAILICGLEITKADALLDSGVSQAEKIEVAIIGEWPPTAVDTAKFHWMLTPSLLRNN